MCKKSLLMMLLMAFFAPWAANAQGLCDPADMCAISFTLTDEYGDGWNGGQIEVVDVLTGTNLATWTISSGASLEGTLDVCVGREIQFNYTTGSWAYENSWVIRDAAGTIIWEGNGSDGSSSQTYTVVCPSCLPPTALTVTLTPGDGTVATLSWTSDADAWQICLNDNETNLIPATTNPYTLTGLTPETTYTAKVRTNCGSEQSAWGNVVTFKPTNDYQLTVNDGTSTNGFVPIYGYYVDGTSMSQFIIPAGDLADMAWGTINKLTFYASQSSVNWGNAIFEVYMAEVDYTTFTSGTPDWTGMEKVMDAGSLGISNNLMVVDLDYPFAYTGGNLMIGIKETTSGSFATSDWYGVNQEANTAIGNQLYSGSSYEMKQFLPKTTFDYEPGEEPACMWPTNLAVSNVTARTAELSWTSDGTAWEVEVVGEYTTTWNADAIPFTLQGLEPETAYTVRVRTVCDTEVYSDWSAPVTFTTGIACTAPTDLVISDITAYSANVAWTGDNENFEVRYAIDNSPVTDFEDSSLQGWTNIDADGDGYVWVLGSQCGGIYLVEGASLAGNGHDGSEAELVTSGSYSNVTGALFPDNYLVSPQVTLGGTISFWAQAQDASYPAEHFGVAVSTTGNTDAADFTTIAEWTFGSRSATVFRSSKAPRGGNRAQTEWVLYTVDLSAYSGQGYVAIRHFNCTDQFLLNVDDIAITSPSGYEWVNVTNPTNPQALTDLEPETKYIVQVRFNCGDEGYSAWLEGSFTTLPSCMVPTDLVISNIDKRSADLAWTANGEETAWQIELSDNQVPPVVTVYDVATTSFTLPGLQPETSYSVRVRAVCDEELQSEWSTPAIFTTLVACPAPTALAISDITNVSAVATWTYDGDVEFEYAEDVWKHYDNGVYPGGGGIGTGSGSDIYWAIMLPPTMLPTEPLTKVSLFEATGYSEEPITLMIYSGGDTAPGTLLYQEEVTPLAADAFHEITLAEPVTFDATQNLWIVCKEYGTYPAIGCNNVDEPNGRWISLDGTEWEDVMNYSLDYTWMIRAGFGDATTEWVAVNNPASPQTIAGLTPETNYMVRLRAVCGGEDGESVWVTTSFTTDVACPAPTALAATPYALSAELSWEGVSESYTVRYGYDEVGETIYSEDFAEGIPTDWTNDATYPWTVVDGYIQSSNAGVSSSTSTISLTMTVRSDANFEFDAECMGEGTSTYWDHCDFYIDGTRVFYHGAELGSGWNHYSFPFTAGEHTFTWSYTKDSSVNPTGDYFAIDNIAINPVNRIWNTTTADTNECTITGLTPMTTYYVQVQGNCGDDGLSEWSEIISFTTLEQQTIALTAGWNWVSSNVEITMDDLKDAIVAAYPSAGMNALSIKSKDDGQSNYNPVAHRWISGPSTIHLEQMYMVKVPEAGEITLEGMPINPAELPITIVPGINWIAFPLAVEMTLSEAFGLEFPVQGDNIQSFDDGQANWNTGAHRWIGQLNSNNLKPGKGYIYNSKATEDKTFVYPTPAK